MHNLHFFGNFLTLILQIDHKKVHKVIEAVRCRRFKLSYVVAYVVEPTFAVNFIKQKCQKCLKKLGLCWFMYLNLNQPPSHWRIIKGRGCFVCVKNG
jgi:hypothetical protein